MLLKKFYKIVFPLTLLLPFVFFITSCDTLGKYDPGFIERNLNNQHITKLRVGMTKEEVLKIMGLPLINQTYNKPNIWFYYTDWDWADAAITKSECTPLVFEDGILLGWGQKFYRNYEQRDWQYNNQSALEYDTYNY